MSNGVHDNDIRIALMVQKQEQDEEEIRGLNKRVANLERSVFAAQIGSAVLIGIGLLLGWLASTGNLVRSWFH